MTIREILDHVDRVKPNAFSEEDKMLWLNELEYAIQADILGMTEGFRSHGQSDEWRGRSVAFTPNSVTIPGYLYAEPGGTLSIEALEWVPDETIFAGVELDDIPIVSAEVGESQTVIQLPSGTFHVMGTSLSLFKITADIGATEPIAPEPYHKIYPAYLEARIEAANGEWNEYDNAMALFNGFLGEYQRWYARNHIDNPETRE